MLRLLLLALLTACGNGSDGRTITAMPAATGATPSATPVRIMPLGDSITQGDFEHDSYRRPLFKSLALSIG